MAVGRMHVASHTANDGTLYNVRMSDIRCWHGRTLKKGVQAVVADLLGQPTTKV